MPVSPVNDEEPDILNFTIPFLIRRFLFCGQIVAGQFLNRSDFSAGCQHMCGKGMAERMAIDPPIDDAGLSAGLPNCLTVSFELLLSPLRGWGGLHAASLCFGRR